MGNSRCAAKAIVCPPAVPKYPAQAGVSWVIGCSPQRQKLARPLIKNPAHAGQRLGKGKIAAKAKVHPPVSANIPARGNNAIGWAIV